MRAIFGRHFLLRSICIAFLILFAVPSVRSQTLPPPRTPEAKGTPADNKPAGQAGTGQTQTGQSRTGQTQTGQTQTGQTATKPVDKPAVCRSPEQEVEYDLAKAQLKGMKVEIDLLQEGIRDMQETARDVAKKIAHYDKVMSGKEELFDEEKDEHIVPSAAKVDAQNDLDERNRDIAEEKKKLELKLAEAYPVQEKIAAFEKLKPCPKVTDTGDLPPQKDGPDKPGPKTPAVAGGCNNSTDEDKLKEYQRLVAFYEKENTDINGQLEKLDKDIDETQANKEMEAGLRKGRLEEFTARKVSLVERKGNNQVAIDQFKLLIKAIVEKKPCPPEEKKISKPETPETGTPTRRTDKGKKDDDRKMTKKSTSTDRTARRTSGGDGASQDKRRSDDDVRAIGTGIGFGIGIGLSRGGGFGDRGGSRGGSRDTSPLSRPE